MKQARQAGNVTIGRTKQKRHIQCIAYIVYMYMNLMRTFEEQFIVRSAKKIGHVHVHVL